MDRRRSFRPAAVTGCPSASDATAPLDGPPRRFTGAHMQREDIDEVPVASEAGDRRLVV